MERDRAGPVRLSKHMLVLIVASSAYGIACTVIDGRFQHENEHERR